MRRVTAVIVWAAVLCGVAGAFVALRGRGSEEVLEYAQSRSLAQKPSPVLSAAHVVALVGEAPEPVPLAARTRPVQVSCRPGSGGTLRNPWSCTILYHSGTVAHYRVTVQPDGHYTGVGSGIITGCCVDAPTLN